MTFNFFLVFLLSCNQINLIINRLNVVLNLTETQKKDLIIELKKVNNLCNYTFKRNDSKN
jgi:hypothetical protein